MTITGSVRRAPKPRNHEQGKPVRGFQKGKRGPNKSQAEIDNAKIAETIARGQRPIIIEAVRDIKGDPNLRPGNTLIPSVNSRTNRDARMLKDLIQEVGSEIISAETKWTRIEAVVRRLFADAMSGKTPATALLLERGWGRVPQPLKVDFQTELKQVVEEAGLTQEEIEADPLLSQLVNNGLMIEGKFTAADAPD